MTEEFSEYQLPRDSDVPDHVIESCNTDRGDLNLNSLWNFIGNTQNALLFPRAWKGVRLILTIPHSIAVEERIFSIVRKNKTCFQQSLDPEETLASMATIKFAMESESVETFNIEQEVFTAAKSTT